MFSFFLAAMLQSLGSKGMIVTSGVAPATLPPSTLIYVGPRRPEPEFENAFDAAIGACGVPLTAVQRRYATLREEPATPEQRAAQETEVADAARRSGFSGPEAEHAFTYEVIRGMLQTRSFIQLAVTAEPAQTRCVTEWLRTQNFAPLRKEQQLPPELRD